MNCISLGIITWKKSYYFNWLYTLKLFIICHNDLEQFLLQEVFVTGCFGVLQRHFRVPKGCQARFPGSYLPGNWIFTLGHFIYFTKFVKDIWKKVLESHYFKKFVLGIETRALYMPSRSPTTELQWFFPPNLFFILFYFF